MASVITIQPKAEDTADPNRTPTLNTQPNDKYICCYVRRNGTCDFRTCLEVFRNDCCDGLDSCCEGLDDCCSVANQNTSQWRNYPTNTNRGVSRNDSFLSTNSDNDYGFARDYRFNAVGNTYYGGRYISSGDCGEGNIDTRHCEGRNIDRGHHGGWNSDSGHHGGWNSDSGHHGGWNTDSGHHGVGNIDSGHHGGGNFDSGHHGGGNFDSGHHGGWNTDNGHCGGGDFGSGDGCGDTGTGDCGGGDFGGCCDD